MPRGRSSRNQSRMTSPESEPSDDGLPALSDEVLMGVFYNDGDRAAIQELHRRYQTKLAGVFLSQGVRREEVEDLVNETWLRVLRTRDRPKARFQPGDGRSFAAWLTTIASNLAKDCWRKSRGGKVVALEDLGPGENADGDRRRGPDEYLRDVGPSVAWQVEAHELLEQALREFSETEGKVWVLREIFGFTAAEAAYVVNSTPVAVNTALSRARDRLEGLCLRERAYLQLFEARLVNRLIDTLDPTTKLINRVFSNDEKRRLRKLLSSNATQGGGTGCRTTRT
jgi:RNA polymerase sigma-70 factor (ECF subfamily)